MYIAVFLIHSIRAILSFPVLPLSLFLHYSVTWYQIYQARSILLNFHHMEANNAEIFNPSHDLFLHPSDNPNSMLVNELLNGRNYATWKKSMEIALIAKNKLGFVLGTTPQPDAEPLQNQWNRCDKMVIS